MSYSDTRKLQQEWEKDPMNWKWGMFYYNRKDKRIIVPKKDPVSGVTLNYAPPASIAITALFLFLITALIILLASAHKA